jgi:phage repressor protein C with HTH and peptisase S24 domain
MDTFAERIEALIAASGMPMPEIARRMGVTKQSLYNLTQGVTKPETVRASTLLALADVLQVSPSAIFYGEHAGQSTKAEPAMMVREPSTSYSVNVEVPLWDARAAAGVSAINDQSGQRGSLLFRERSLRKKGINPETSHCFYVAGDSMAPRITDGAVVLFDTSDTIIRSGKVYVIQWEEDTLLKRLFREGADAVRVCSDNKSNPEYQDRIAQLGAGEFRVLGRMRWFANWDD